MARRFPHLALLGLAALVLSQGLPPLWAFLLQAAGLLAVGLPLALALFWGGRDLLRRALSRAQAGERGGPPAA